MFEAASGDADHRRLRDVMGTLDPFGILIHMERDAEIARLREWIAAREWSLPAARSHPGSNK
jgi:hypothetical protein